MSDAAYPQQNTLKVGLLKQKRPGSQLYLKDRKKGISRFEQLEPCQSSSKDTCWTNTSMGKDAGGLEIVLHCRHSTKGTLMFKTHCSRLYTC